jgi:hypothetical protein
VGLVSWLVTACHIDGVDCLLAFDAGVGVSAAEFSVCWAADSETAGLGVARVSPAPGQVFLPGLVEFVLIPLGVNLAASVLVALVSRIVRAARRPVSETTDVEVSETVSPDGRRVLVVRARRVRT